MIIAPLELQRLVRKLLRNELVLARRRLRAAKTGVSVAAHRRAQARVRRVEALLELIDSQPLTPLALGRRAKLATSPDAPPAPEPPKQLDMLDRLRKRVAARAPRRTL